MKTVNELVEMLSKNFKGGTRNEHIGFDGKPYAEEYKFIHHVEVCGYEFPIAISTKRFYRDGMTYYSVEDYYSGYPFSDFNREDYADFISFVTKKSLPASKRMVSVVKKEIEAAEKYLFDLYKSFGHVLEAA